ncbi:endonuclease domain-containing protein [Dietzia cinnamea]|uniref:endonuclease domain-containing protein n=1 Tax=Dietzia cinnamea TaxID=321318 RepID=UPI00223C4F33|nr:endonuclease domain-containing protein [Dietzia cinnamea]MCT2120445.1 endonuclease domain-containing protein [Dietzia cinnamea]MCT2300552.1 endonuclease domain-containing protein [Dietzia cinnamea]
MSTSDSRPPFLGSRARAAREVSEFRLSSSYRRLFPDVYAEKSAPLEPLTLVRGAVLWAPGGSVVCGLAAALLHGERWYAPEAVPRKVEIYAVGTPKPPSGIRVRRLRRPIAPDQLAIRDGLAVTTPARTAIDIARWEDDDERAIAKIDAVCNRSQTPVSEVRALASELSGLHGLQRVRGLLSDCDHRADSPRETRLRLVLTRSHLPDPIPQVTIYNEYGAKVTVADFAYPEARVAIFYDGKVHRRKSTWEHDARVNAELAELGWQVIRVTAQMLRGPRTLIRQIEAALARGLSLP